MIKKLFAFVILILGIIACETPTEDNNNVADSDSTQTEVVEIDSLQFLTDQIQSNTKNAEFWAARALYFLRIGNVSDATVDMKSAVRLDSTNTTYRNYYGSLLVSNLDLETAMDNYEYVLSVDSSNAKAYVGLGRIYALIDNPGLATGYLNKAYQIDPHLSEAYFLEGLIYRSDYYDTGREESWERALSSFQTAVEQNPDYYAAYIEMGVMNEERRNDISLDYFNTALDLAPNSIEAWYNKAMYFQNRAKYEQAKTCYRSIIQIDSTYPEAYYNQGYIKLVYEKEYDSSIYFFDKTTQLDTAHFQAYNNLGLSYEYSGDIEKAKVNYRKAIDINPDFKLAKDNLNLVSK